jgi:hypothetical protein
MPVPVINPAVITQLVAISKLKEKTGIELIKLLTFWGNISTAGEKSLYKRLFLTHNLQAIDDVFKSDGSGNYLSDPNEPIFNEGNQTQGHVPVLMAALRVTEPEIRAIVNFRSMDNSLTLENVSALYRHALFAKLVKLSVEKLDRIIDVFGDPLVDPITTLNFLELWEDLLKSKQFNISQLWYVLTGHDDVEKPIGIQQIDMLKIKKTIFDGLLAIDNEHKDIAQQIAESNQVAIDPAIFSIEVVHNKASLLLEQDFVESIEGLLQGTTVYSTNAPATLDIVIPDALKEKLTYNRDLGSLQIIGILNADEKTEAMNLNRNQGWREAIKRITRQPVRFFNLSLAKMLMAEEVDLTAHSGSFDDLPYDNFDPHCLLKGDANDGSNDTSSLKRQTFLTHFLPYLRAELTEDLIVETVAKKTNVPQGETRTLLVDVLEHHYRTDTYAGRDGENVCAFEVLRRMKDKVVGAPWQGHLVIAKDESYRFFTKENELNRQPSSFFLEASDGTSPEGTNGFIAFDTQQEDPSNIWYSKSIRLKRGIYRLQISDRSPEEIQWQTATSLPTAIPPSALYPECSEDEVNVLTQIDKASMLVRGYSLNDEEIRFWHQPEDFDFNYPTYSFWQKLQSYAMFRDSLERIGEFSLIDLFRWAAEPTLFRATSVAPVATSTNAMDHLPDKISMATGWDAEEIRAYLQKDDSGNPIHFGFTRLEDFQDEEQLKVIQTAMRLRNKLCVSVARAFDWAMPRFSFRECHRVAQDIRSAIRGRFDQTSWEEVIKPLNDTLRVQQRDALIAHLLVQEELVDWGVIDADSLYEFFLIDVQMEACFKTSRIKQAISSVQQFVHRAFIGLERGKVSNGAGGQVPIGRALDRNRWEWMQRYRVWEANRKVFLYPENWIRPELRDDKSPLYRTFESELLQNDTSWDAFEVSTKDYVSSLQQISNLKAVGIFLNEGRTLGSYDDDQVHIFARSRNEPYLYYHRSYDMNASTWQPWFPASIDVKSPTGAESKGTYLVPAMLGSRLLVFTPQITKVQKQSTKTFRELTRAKLYRREKKYQTILGVRVHVGWEDIFIGYSDWKEVANRKPTAREMGELPEQFQVGSEEWQVEMAWSEFSNQSWTSKQVSDGQFIVSKSAGGSDRHYLINSDTHQQYIQIGQTVATDADLFVIAPTVNSDSSLRLDVFHPGDQPPYKFEFSSNNVSRPSELSSSSGPNPTRYHYQENRISSLQSDNRVRPLFGHAPFVEDSFPKPTIQLPGRANNETFYHSFVDSLRTAAETSMDALFAAMPQLPAANEYGLVESGKYHELSKPYSLYNWELGFHCPMAAALGFLRDNNFEEALKAAYLVFDPFAEGDDQTKNWKFAPFKASVGSQSVKDRLVALQAGKADAEISDWRDNPFQPHRIARSRPLTYPMWTVMKYIEMLIAVGDHYFRQDTMETLVVATQYYVLASHIYGPKSQRVPRKGKIEPETYNSLLNNWDAFGNALVKMELLPFNSEQVPTTIESDVEDDVRADLNEAPTPNVFGFASALYFCIPDNPRLSEMRETIDDRLYKIRHCQNIKGVFRELPLFEPPIDPALLVQAAAQGLDLSSVLNDLNSPAPNYRFTNMLQRAIDLCGEVKNLGAVFLSAKEKRDSEKISQLRASHESTIQKMLLDNRQLQIDEARKSLDSLKHSRESAAYRLSYFLRLIGEDLEKIPSSDANFSELTNLIEAPIETSGLKLSQHEKHELDKASQATKETRPIGNLETLASSLHGIPAIDGMGAFWGVGIKIGFPALAAAASAVARQKRIGVDELSAESSRSSRLGGFHRQLQDRIHQANVSGFEITNTDKQILTQEIRMQLAEKEFNNQLKQIEQADEIEDFLRTKYSNVDLYDFMESRLRSLHYSAYQMAYDMAKKAEKVFQFERGLSTSDFIKPGYWENGRDGMFAGEQLYQALKKLEVAHIENRDHDFEVTKHVSLREISPIALLQLRKNGSCEFEVPEILFDLDFPGHYKRRIRSVAISVPCVVGPHTSLNCTLRLLAHQFRHKSNASGGGDYPRDLEQDDDRFLSTNIPITAIAASSGQNDAGVFELTVQQERYLPFEGAGAASKWRVEFPTEFRQFDYSTITDVILHMQYTSKDGGNKLQQAATENLKSRLANADELARDEGVFAIFDLQHDFSVGWSRFASGVTGTKRLELKGMKDRLSHFAKNGASPRDVYLLSTEENLELNGISLNESQFTETTMREIKGAWIESTDLSFDDEWVLTRETEDGLKNVWMIVRMEIS